MSDAKFFSKPELFIGPAILIFGFVTLVLQHVLFTSPSSAMPDPEHGLTFICVMKGTHVYFSDFSIVRSWAPVPCAALMLVGHLVSGNHSPNYRGRGLPLPNTPPSWAGMGLGALLAFLFVLFVEAGVVDWVMSLRFRPPAIGCLF